MSYRAVEARRFERSRRGTIASAMLLILSLFMNVAEARTVTYFLTDPLGTVLASTDSIGSIGEPSEFRPYGAPALADTETPAFFAGHPVDAGAEFIYMQARYYDPYTGRFLSVDPIAPASGDLVGIGRYTYGSNNPTLRTDPTGMSDECSAACRKLRQLSDSMGISGALKGAVHGSGGPIGQANATLRTLNGGVETSAAQELANVAPAADLLPGVSFPDR